MDSKFLGEYYKLHWVSFGNSNTHRLFFYKKLIKEPNTLKFRRNFQGTGRVLLSMYGCGNGCSFILATPTGCVSAANANLCIDQAEI